MSHSQLKLHSFLLFTFLALMLRQSAGTVDLRRALGTKTRYAFRLPIPDSPSAHHLPDPEGYEAIHLWLLSRHGTRWPTKDRMRQINTLEHLFKDARSSSAYPWIDDWKSPVKRMQYAEGELHSIGEGEMWGLAQRLRSRFPSLVAEPYFPRRYPVRSTQVHRTAASASAFTLGFFPNVNIDNDDAKRHPQDVLAMQQLRTGANSGTGSSAASTSDSDSVTAAATRGAKQGGEGGLLRQIVSPLRRSDVSTQQRAAQSSSSASLSSSSAASATSTASRLSSSPSSASIASSGSSASLLDVVSDDDSDLPYALGYTGKRPQAVAITMFPKQADPMLRFFDMCPAYAQHEEYLDKWIGGWMSGNWSKLGPLLSERLRMQRSMEPCEVEALWQLCQFEAGLYGDVERVCSLFEPVEASLMEWMDDVHLMESQAYGDAVNYRIAAPLLQDLRTSLKSAASSDDPVERARLLFAHCETLVPLAALMGLFRPDALTDHDYFLGTSRAAPASRLLGPNGETLARVAPVGEAQQLMSEVDAVEDVMVHLEQQQQRAAGGAVGGEELSMCARNTSAAGGEVPPPAGWQPLVPFEPHRLFRGSRVAPFGANMALVLYRQKGGDGARSKHKVRLLYNEQVLPIPGCSSGNDRPEGGDDAAAYDCDLEELLALTEHRATNATLDAMCKTPAAAGSGNGKVF